MYANICTVKILDNEIVIGSLTHSQVFLDDHCTCVVLRDHFLVTAVHHSALLSSPLTPQTRPNTNNHAFDSRITISL